MKRMALLLLVTLVALLAMTAVAYAATPQDIYNDYAADNKLDSTYTKAELQAYLDDAAIHQYGNPTILAGLDALAKQLIAQEEEGTFPFTGFEMAIALFGGAALLGSGVLIRKWAR